jgi:hypothetical protein
MAMFVFTFAVMTAVSAKTPAVDPASLASVMTQRHDLGSGPGAAEISWIRDYRFLAAGLGVLMAGLVITFW